MGIRNNRYVFEYIFLILVFFIREINVDRIRY